MLLLGWSHRYKNSKVIMTNWLTFTKYLFLKWQWIFFPFTYFFSFLSPQSQTRLLPELIIWVTRLISYRKQELLTLREHMGHPRIFGGVNGAHLISFLCCVFNFVWLTFCVLSTVLAVCLDCPVFIAPWLSNFY